MNEPLTFTPFEEFLYWLDRPTHPCLIFVRMHFDGLLDREAVELALDTALRRHPLLCSLVQEQGRSFQWVPVDDPHVELDWRDGEVGGPPPAGGHVDLRQQIGVRAVVVQGATKSEMTLQVHHACTDGGGLHAFMQDFLLAYASLRGGESPNARLPRLNVERLKQRASHGLTIRKFLKMLPKQLVGLVGAFQFFSRRPATVLPSAGRGELPENFPTYLTRVFSKDVARALRSAARREGVSYNDLLMRDVFVAVHKWRQPHASTHREWLRMMVPMDLRTRPDLAMPAANVVSSVFFDRRGTACEAPDSLLMGLHREMQLIRNLQLGLTLVFTLRWLSLFRGALRRLATKDRCMTSFVLTNLGNVFRRTPLPTVDGRLRVGDVVMDKVDAAVPVEPHNFLVVAAHHYARELTVTLNYDSRAITQEQIQDLMDLLSQQLHESAGIADAAPVSKAA